ncbi:ABC transporter substrate-binding protein [Anabaena sp. UHCC 0187]|uniref:metal ABC transporter solute-binding protein, Zn/Mn family n=1 Tax=Anabaena sp. UHCC 0187 TaxID=2590018 RepID=UPI0014477340|nr:zinc ABC transporter substrate-binding protein [Anabaena sp. UHCC 0187]MDP5016806.1 zinc ABC transporter substrate-binding protein [Dolichospermum sp.]MTJ13208.1 ABC transporter substrate-binding protein [Anabaena sp. UHCC 0187]
MNSPKEIKTDKKPRNFLPLITLIILSAVYGCNNPNSGEVVKTEPVPAQKIPKTKVVTTFLPVYLFTKAVAGDVADVEILVKPGTEVHEYQGTPANVKAIATAKILVKNGLGLEEFLADTIKNAENSQLVEIDASKGISAINKISPIDKTAAAEHDHDHQFGNPHVWLDPVLAKQQIINIRDGLITADPENKVNYQANAAAYIQKLDNLNNEFQQTIKQTPNCTFITFHDAFPYLAKRYNIKQLAVVEIPEKQLSPTDVQKVVNTVKKYKVKALFSEPGLDNKLLTSISQDLGLTVRTLDSLETGDTNPEYYFKAMKANLESLSAGCK